MSFKNLPLTAFIKDRFLFACKKFVKKYPIYKFGINKEKINIEKTKNCSFGSFSTNFVMTLDIDQAKKIKIAKKIVDFIPKKAFTKIEIIEPGFINFYLNNNIKTKLLKTIVKYKEKYGQFKKKKLFYNLELVSANPTGFLHIGHARNGVYGDCLTNIWKKYGIKVDKEYYINDAGEQINKLALTVLIRYLQLFDKPLSLPEDSYYGEEIIQTAKALKAKYEDKYINTTFDQNKITDLTANNEISDFAKQYLLSFIKQHLQLLGINIDIWAPESNIYKFQLIPKILICLNNELYKKDEATWLKTTKYGDDKDRVLIKSDKKYTYFLPDIAYHDLKLSRGYDKIFNIWGADHKSYVDRMHIALECLGYSKTCLQVFIMQLVQLIKNGQEVKMSKRSGNSLFAIDLINFLGKDASRWNLINQSLDSHLKIDIDKAKLKTNENKLFYVQYAYVRIKQILKKTPFKISKKTNLLSTNLEITLIDQLLFFMPLIEKIAKNYQVHDLCLYLVNLAKFFHNYYETTKINDLHNKQITQQRLFLIQAIAIIIKNGLAILGIDVYENM